MEQHNLYNNETESLTFAEKPNIKHKTQKLNWMYTKKQNKIILLKYTRVETA